MRVQHESWARGSRSDRWVAFGAVVILLLLATWMLVPRTLLHPREGCTLRGACASHLRQIGTLSLLYSQRLGQGWLPIGPGPRPRAHESLNLLVHWDPEALDPRLFLCPEADQAPAVRDADTGAFALAGDTLSYAWTSQPLRDTAPARPLGCDKQVDGEDGKRAGHRGGRNVLFTDGSVRWMQSGDWPTGAELPEGLIR